jgi:hypothetical protein
MEEVLERLIENFVNNAQNYGKALEEGDSELTNKKYGITSNTLKEIRDFGKEGEIALSNLRSHDNISVRYWAAIYSMKYDKRKSIKVLKAISKRSGAIAFSAEMFLEQYNNGTIEGLL